MCANLGGRQVGKRQEASCVVMLYCATPTHLFAALEQQHVQPRSELPVSPFYASTPLNAPPQLLSCLVSCRSPPFPSHHMLLDDNANTLTHLHNPHNPGCLAGGVVEEGLVSQLHGTQVVASHIVAHTCGVSRWWCSMEWIRGPGCGCCVVVVVDYCLVKCLPVPPF